MADFGAWAEGERERVLLVVVPSVSSGTTTTHYFSNGEYRTGSGESVPNQVFADRLIGGAEFDRAMGSAFDGDGASYNGAEIVVSNIDGERDTWIYDDWHGQILTAYYGDPSWTWAEMTSVGQVFQGTVQETAQNDREFRIILRDPFAELDEPAQQVMVYLGPHIGDRFPMGYGYFLNATPLIRETNPGSANNVEYVTNPDGSDVEDAVVAVYKNQAEEPLGDLKEENSDSMFKFTTDRNGLVTVDAKGWKDSSGTYISTLGSALKHLLTFSIDHTIGMAQGGSSNTIILDQNASDEDDIYNGLNIEKGRFVDNPETDEEEVKTISDYDGSTHTVTITGTWTVNPADGEAGWNIKNASSTPGLFTEPQLDTAAFTQFDADYPGTIGAYIAEGETLREVFEYGLGPGAFYGPNRNGKLTLGILPNPDTATADWTLVENDFVEGGNFEVEKSKPPIWRLLLGYKRNYTPVRGSAAGSIDAERQAFIAKEFRFHRREEYAIKQRFANARELTVETYIQDIDDAKTEVDRLWDLFGGTQRYRYYPPDTLTKPFQFELGDVVNVTDPRHWLSGGKNLVVTRIVERPLEGRTELELWG